jgi:hypothetical protein
MFQRAYGLQMNQWESGPYKGPFCYWRMEKKRKKKKKKKEVKSIFLLNHMAGITSKETAALLTTTDARYL